MMPAGRSCRICDELFPKIDFPRRQCTHVVVQTNTYRCPPNSHNFNGDPSLDCVAKIVWKASFHDSDIHKCEHPNVVKHIATIDLNRDEEVVVTHFCKSGTLRWLHQSFQKRSHEQVVALLVQVLLALNHLHANNLMHRDVSINNIFVASVTTDGRPLVRLGDFGLSKTTHEASVGDDNFHSVVGTKPYMAPEVRRERKYNATADIFSLGAVIFEYVTGHQPFSTNADEATLSQRKRQLLFENSPTPEVTELILAMMSPEPLQRPTTVGAFTAFPFMRAALKAYWDSFQSTDGAFLPHSEAAERTLQRQVLVLSQELHGSDSTAVFIARIRRFPSSGASHVPNFKVWTDVYVDPKVGIWSVRLRNKASVHFVDAEDVWKVELSLDQESMEEEQNPSREIITDDDEEESQNTFDEAGSMVDVWSQRRKTPYVFGAVREADAKKLVKAIQDSIDMRPKALQGAATTGIPPTRSA